MTSPTDDSWAPTDIDTTVPSVARMYDYYLDGKDNFQVDREAAEKIIEVFPDIRLAAQQNRALLQRAVRAMVESGIRQFIDLGSGLPTQRNLHEVAQEAAPDTRVVYVDHDPIVLAHARALLTPDHRTTVIDADLREPDQVLSDPRLLRLIDFDEPVGLMAVAVLHFVPDAEGPASIIRRYLDRFAAGSQLLISHATRDGVRAEAADNALEAYTAAQAVFRSAEEIEALFGGIELLNPGLVHTWEWRSDQTDPLTRPTTPPVLAGLGRVTRARLP